MAINDILRVFGLDVAVKKAVMDWLLWTVSYKKAIVGYEL
jgi:hypothetical protein